MRSSASNVSSLGLYIHPYITVTDTVTRHLFYMPRSKINRIKLNKPKAPNNLMLKGRN